MRFHHVPSVLAFVVLATLGHPVAAHAGKSTTLLLPFVSNQAGFDTGLSIANTNADPFGEKEAVGSCTLSYFSQSGGSFPAQTTTQIDAGRSAVFTLSTGGTNGIAARAGFQGYMIIDCDFPNARAYGFFSDLGAQKLGASVPVEIIKRKDRK